MQVSVAPRCSTTAAFPLTALDPAQLDSLDLPQLYDRASASMLEARDIDVLDRVYRVKVTRTLMTSAVTADEIGQLIGHLSKMRTLLRRKASAADAETVCLRWAAFIDLLDIASHLVVERESTPAAAHRYRQGALGASGRRRND